MKKIRLVSMTLLILGIVITSCKKKDETIVPQSPSETRCFVIKASSGDGRIQNYDYHNELLVNEYQLDSNGVEVNNITYEYENDILLYVYNNGSKTAKTVIENNRIIKLIYYEKDSLDNYVLSDRYEKYNYDINGDMIKKENYTDTLLTGYVEQIWENGNPVIRTSYYLSGSQMTFDARWTNTFDEMKNPLYNIGVGVISNGFFNSKNNFLASTVQYLEDGPISPDFSIEYTYNSDSYPLTWTTEYSTGHYTYNCD